MASCIGVVFWACACFRVDKLSWCVGIVHFDEPVGEGVVFASVVDFLYILVHKLYELHFSGRVL